MPHGSATPDLCRTLTVNIHDAVPRTVCRPFHSGFPRPCVKKCRCPHLGRTPWLQPKILQHPPVDPVSGPVPLPAPPPPAVGRCTSAGGLDVAQIPGCSVQLAAE